jgi:hypothetical protein
MGAMTIDCSGSPHSIEMIHRALHARDPTREPLMAAARITKKALDTVARSLVSETLPVASLSSAAGSKVLLPDLPYDFGALEPFISADIMALHHGKHHNAYVTNLKAALEQYAEAELKGDVAKMIALQGAIRFNGGGHINHSIFWTNLAPSKQGGGGEPEGALKKYIDKSFGSFEVSFAALVSEPILFIAYHCRHSRRPLTLRLPPFKAAAGAGSGMTRPRTRSRSRRCPTRTPSP